jgi:hypothetical protein
MTVQNKSNVVDIFTQESFVDPVVLDCGHTFEKAHIIAWLARDRICPTCRTEVRRPLITNYIVNDFNEEVNVLTERNEQLSDQLTNTAQTSENTERTIVSLKKELRRKTWLNWALGVPLITGIFFNIYKYVVRKEPAHRIEKKTEKDPKSARWIN